MDRPVKVQDLVDMWVEIKKLTSRVTRLEANQHEAMCNSKAKDINQIF